jgi:hypothetical protein
VCEVTLVIAHSIAKEDLEAVRHAMGSTYLCSTLPWLYSQLTSPNHSEPRNSSLMRFFMITSSVKSNKIPVVNGIYVNPDDAMVSNPRLIQRYGVASRRNEASLGQEAPGPDMISLTSSTPSTKIPSQSLSLYNDLTPTVFLGALG